MTSQSWCIPTKSFGIQYSFLSIMRIPFFTTQVSLTQFQINFTDKLFLLLLIFHAHFLRNFFFCLFSALACRVGTGSVEICDKTFASRKKGKSRAFSSAAAGLKRLCVLRLPFFSINLFTVKCVMFAFTIVVYLAIKEISFRVFYWLFSFSVFMICRLSSQNRKAHSTLDFVWNLCTRYWI